MGGEKLSWFGSLNGVEGGSVEGGSLLKLRVKGYG